MYNLNVKTLYKYNKTIYVHPNGEVFLATIFPLTMISNVAINDYDVVNNDLKIIVSRKIKSLYDFNEIIVRDQIIVRNDDIVVNNEKNHCISKSSLTRIKIVLKIYRNHCSTNHCKKSRENRCMTSIRTVV